MTIAGNTFNATQVGVACNDTISPGSKAFAVGGESTSVGVTAPGGCSWSATSNDSWITVTAGSSGSAMER